MKEISFRNDILPLGDQLFRLAMRITRNRQEAEDVVQDTLIRLWEGREQLNEIKNPATYAMTICRNLSLDRMERMEHRNISLDEEVHDRQDNDRTPDEQLMNNQRHEAVNDMISRLPEKQRTIIQLRDIEGKNYQEIAETMNLSLSDVKVTLFRARQAVKERITGKNNH